MSAFDPEHFKNTTSEKPQPSSHIGWSNLATDTRLKLIGVSTAEVGCAFGWAASFSSVNPVANGVFLADFVPITLPQAMQNISAASLINLGLGFMAVIIPAVLWHLTLKNQILKDVRGYFLGDVLRMAVGGLLGAAYAMLIGLEILSLRLRVTNSLDTSSPIPTLGNPPEILPLALASGALILGSCLLGLASASLFQSIHNRYAD